VREVAVELVPLVAAVQGALPARPQPAAGEVSEPDDLRGPVVVAVDVERAGVVLVHLDRRELERVAELGAKQSSDKRE